MTFMKIGGETIPLDARKDMLAVRGSVTWREKQSVLQVDDDATESVTAGGADASVPAGGADAKARVAVDGSAESAGVENAASNDQVNPAEVTEVARPSKEEEAKHRLLHLPHAAW